MKVAKIMLKVALVTLLLLSTPHLSIADANPAPFGLEIGKTTVEEMLKKYKYVKRVKSGKHKNILLYRINPRHFDFEGLLECKAIFGQDGKLVAVINTITKNRFQHVYELMKDKYKLVDSQIPFVGDKFAVFVAGDTNIILDAPHLSFVMTLAYIQRDFLKAYNETIKKEKEEKTQKERSLL